MRVQARPVPLVSAQVVSVSGAIRWALRQYVQVREGSLYPSTSEVGIVAPLQLCAKPSTVVSSPLIEGPGNRAKDCRYAFQVMTWDTWASSSRPKYPSSTS